MSPKQSGPVVTRKKRNRVSKKNKAAWRKHCDIKDVEVYLNDVRHEERVGVKFDSVKDDVLFFEDLTPFDDDNAVQLTENARKLKAKETLLQGPKCHRVLQSRSCVPVPVGKRDKCDKSKQNPILQEILDKKRKVKDVKAKETILKTIRKQKLKKKIKKSVKDAWNGTKDEKLNREWLGNETYVHLMKGTRKMKPAVPSSLIKKNSSIPAVEAPHPGTSYNPSYVEHQNLLLTIGEKEKGLLKTEQHLMRVTHNMFSLTSRENADSNLLKEMSEGLPLSDEMVIKEEKDDGTEFNAVNPPTLDKKKTQKTRRNIKLANKVASEQKLKAIEKKKVADIYKLKKINENILNTELKSSVRQEIRKEKKTVKRLKTNRLSKIKFEEYDTEFKMPYELEGNLREMKPSGNILLERFKSLQKRNILQPAQFQRIRNRGKKKVFIKSSHKIEQVDK